MYNNSFITLCFITFENKTKIVLLFKSNILPFQNHIIFKIDFNIIFKLLLTFKLIKLKNEKQKNDISRM